MSVVASFRLSRLLRVTFLAGLWLGLSQAASASTCNWALLGSGNWSTSTNWSCGHYPGQTGPDIANITGLSLSATITIDVAVPQPVNVQTALLLLPVNITIPSGSSLILDTGTATANTTFNVGGTLGVASGVTINGLVADVNLNGGTINALGTLTLASGRTFTFNSGTITGGGSFGTLSGAIANFAGSGAMSISGGTTFSNAGTLNLLNDTTVSTVGGGSITNTGTLAKTGGAGGAAFSQIDCTVNNSGTVNVGAFKIYLAGGGTHTGAFTGAGTIAFNGAHQLNGTATINGVGQMHLVGGTLTSTVATLTLPVTLHSDGALITNAAMQTGGIYTWDGGTISGDGVAPAPSLTVTSFGAMNISGATNTLHLANNISLTNQFTVNFNSANTLGVITGAQINNTNLGTFNFQGTNLGIANGGGGVQFLNSGSVVKTGAGTLTPIGLPFNNNGTTTVTTGTLQLQGGGSAGATSIFNVAGTLDFNSGTFGLTPGVQLNGAGTCQISGATVQTAGTVTVPTAAIQFDDGTLSGAGTFVVGAGSTMTIGSGMTYIDGATTLEIAGTVNDNANLVGYLELRNGSFVKIDAAPLGHLNINTATEIGSDTTSNAINNFGVVTKANAGTALFDVAFNNQTGGSLTVTGGELQLERGGTSNAPFTVSPGATLSFPAIGYNLAPGSLLNGAGIYKITGTGQLNVNTALNAPTTLNQDGGILSGMADLTVAGGSTYNWTGGIMFSSGGKTVVNGGSLLIDTTTAGVELNSRAINMTSGTMRWTGTNALTMKQAAAINLSALFDIQATGTLASFGFSGGSSNRRLQPNLAPPPPPNTIAVNAGGTLQKSTNSGQMVIVADVTNNGGSVSTSAGLLALAGSGTVSHTGTFTAGGTAILDFSGGTHTIGATTTFNGTGTFEIHGATMNFTQANTPMPNLLLAGGSINLAPVTTSSSFVWDGGTIGAGGAVVVNAGTANVSGANGALTLGGTLTVGSGVTLNYTAPSGITGGGGQIVNNGTFVNTGSSDIAGLGTFTNNSGAIYKYTGTVAHTLGAAFGNAGTVQILSGTQNFGSSYSQSAGTTTVGPGNVGLSTLTLNGGILNGKGTITGDVNNAGGNVNPGTSPGILTITGNYTQGAAGALNLDLNGTTAGTLYDQLNVSGTATLGGALNATLGYTPANNDAFNVLTFGTRVNDFANYNLPPIVGPPPGTIQHSFAAGNALQLLVAIPQADLVVTQTVSPSTILHNQTATFTINVKNNGPSPTSAVTVTNTFVGGTYASVSSTAGTTCSGTGPVICTIGALNVGTTETITLVLTGSSVGAMTNTAAAVTTATLEAAPGNETAAATVTVNGSADLSVAIGGPASVVAATNANYTVTVTNAGPDPALPTLALSMAGGTIVSVTGPAGWTCNTAGCNGAVLASGSNAVVTVSAMAPSQPGAMTLTALVGPTASDPNTANNSATMTTAVTASADVEVLKTLATPFVAGTTVQYNISVKNLGPSDATGVTLSDPAVAGLTFVSASGTCTGGFPCAIGTIPAGQSLSVVATYSLASNASGSMTNTATVTSTTPDPSAANNTSAVTSTVLQKADLSVTKTGPAMALTGSNVTYSITVMNNGPSDATGVQLSDPTPARLTFVSATGACTSLPCAIGNLPASANKSLQVTYTVAPGPTTTIVNTATVTSATPDPNSGNNSASASTVTGCPTSAPANLSPADGATNVPVNGAFSWSDVNAVGYTVYLDVVGPNGSCSKFFAGTGATSAQYAGLQPGTTYQWRVEAVSNGCTTLSSSCIRFTTAGTASSCPTTPPTLIAPVNNNVSGSATFSWSAVSGATQYDLFLNGKQIATTAATSFGPVTIGSGQQTWYVVADFAPPCTALQSQPATFNGCDANTDPPIPSLVGEAASGQGYDFLFTSVNGATKYEVDESTDRLFGSAATTTQSTTATSLHFLHTVTNTTAFYYRVRAFLPCLNGFTTNSVTVRVVIAPVIVPTNPNVSVPIGNKQLVPLPVHIPGFPGQTLPFTATLDNKPWLIRVQPSSGVLPPEGVDLIVFADPATLPNGTFTGTVILLVATPGSGRVSNNGTTPVSVPVSISMVTPVTPKPAGTPPPNALIIPSVGHLDGINSHWQSDIRVANTASQSIHYQLTFTPDDATKGVKQTIISVDAGATTALDDIIKTWYGIGSLGETANGVLEIRPLDNPAKGGPANDDLSVSFTTTASSRTYNVASNSVGGTLGQFIPAVPFNNFVGRALDQAHAATVLGLQQIAQNDAFRTNVGVVEAAGQPASVLISAFDSSGKKLLDFPLDLAPNQQVQLNSFLAQNKITLSDGRLEVKVTGGDGKITAYASVVDNKSGDPLLVSGVPIGQNAFDHFVLPGVADLNTGVAAWRTDMRIFNPTPTAQFVTLSFYPQNSSAQPQITSMSINPGEVRKLDNTMSSLFGLTNIGGAVHVTTNSATPLVITGRTYNVASDGSTFGQFIPAVTSADAVGKSDRPLQVLQVEDSVRYRTNLGIAEVTGKPATVEVQVFLPDSKFAPSTQIPVPANGFVQLPVIQSMGLTNVYNARISLRVVDGDGKVSAYGSVIDQTTQDPTYVPAQK
jgi:uncharacterized repeat protein (TIGR01451 family)